MRAVAPGHREIGGSDLKKCVAGKVLAGEAQAGVGKGAGQGMAGIQEGISQKLPQSITGALRRQVLRA